MKQLIVKDIRGTVVLLASDVKKITTENQRCRIIQKRDSIKLQGKNRSFLNPLNYMVTIVRGNQVIFGKREHPILRDPIQCPRSIETIDIEDSSAKVLIKGFRNLTMKNDRMENTSFEDIEHLNLKHTGMGKVKITNVDHLFLEQSGMGSIDIYGDKMETITVNRDSIGEVRIHVQEINELFVTGDSEDGVKVDGKVKKKSFEPNYRKKIKVGNVNFYIK